MTELWLVRHGQTDWNLEGRFQGQSNVPLNSEGIAQAQQLAEKLMKEKTFDAIFSSDLGRAYRTAEIIADEEHLPVQVDHRLREVNQGRWEGMLVGDVAKTYQDIWESRSTKPEEVRAPGGESVIEVSERMIEAANDIACRYPKGRVLVVSHGLSLATLLCNARKIPLALVYSHILNNAEPQIVEWPADDCAEGRNGKR